MNRKAKLEEEADRLIRDLVIFPRDGYKCQRCDGTREGNILDPHHVIRRGNRRLRWDKKNIITLCRSCHYFQRWHPGDFDTWYSFKFPDRWAYINAHKPEIFRVNVSILEELIEDLKQGKEIFT